MSGAMFAGEDVHANSQKALGTLTGTLVGFSTRRLCRRALGFGLLNPNRGSHLT